MSASSWPTSSPAERDEPDGGDAGRLQRSRLGAGQPLAGRGSRLPHRPDAHVNVTYLVAATPSTTSSRRCSRPRRRSSTPSSKARRCAPARSATFSTSCSARCARSRPVFGDSRRNRRATRISSTGCSGGRAGDRRATDAGRRQRGARRRDRRSAARSKRWPRRSRPPPERYRFASATQPGVEYEITVDGADVICNCPGFEYRGQCRHARDLKVGCRSRETAATSVSARADRVARLFAPLVAVN